MAGYKRIRTIVESDSGEIGVIVGQEGTKVPSDTTKLTVGDVEKLTGVKATTLRYYDKIGLLCPTRTGEGVSNNRKLYGADDLDRLQTIQTLSGYYFSLNEIRHILDDANIDLSDVFTQKLFELRRRVNRLRSLILFTKFTEITDASDADLLEDLACGPVQIDQLADLARDSVSYEKAIEKLERCSDEEGAAALDDLTSIMDNLFMADESSSFAEIQQAVNEFSAWWDAFVVPMEDIGYLGFWAIFEDHGLIAERIETIGEAGDAGFIQMYVFFVWITNLMKRFGESITEIARLADEDVVAALEDAYELIDEFAYGMLGQGGAEPVDSEVLADLAYCMAQWIEGILADAELEASLDLEGNVTFSCNDIMKVAWLFDVLGSAD